MSIAISEFTAPCRFRAEHPTVQRPASRLPLFGGARQRHAPVCGATQRGLRANSRPRLRDSRYRRPATRTAPRRTS
jgi:hypothetical protein